MSMPIQNNPPRSVIVVGAGMIGLSTAWHLQRLGAVVTVIDKSAAGAGASWGNAGWIPPGLVTPLAEPGAWRHAVASLTDPNAPLHVPIRADPSLWAFLLRFSRNMTKRRWDKAMTALQPITGMAIDAFKLMTSAGIDSPIIEAPYVIGFSSGKAADSFQAELEHLQRMGQPTDHRLLDRTADAPFLSTAVVRAIEMTGQSYLDPGDFTAAMVRSIVAGGGRVLQGRNVTGLDDGTASVSVLTSSGERLSADAAVLATGAWLPQLARPWGLKMRVQAGRGYSFTVNCDPMPKGPIYFTEQRVVGTPYQGALRIAGTMEFRGPDEPLDAARIAAVINAVRPLLSGVDWDSRRDTWVGSRPVTPDGLPVIGQLRSPRVYASGGHGMWGIVLGPASGRLLAEQIMTGVTPPELLAFDPLRR